MAIRVRTIAAEESEILDRWQWGDDIVRHRRARALRLSETDWLSWPQDAIHVTISWFSSNNPNGRSLPSHTSSNGCVYSARTGSDNGAALSYEGEEFGELA
jgi:hypothetical protein